MENLQRAINYETVVSVMKKTDLFCIDRFLQIESETGDEPFISCLDKCSAVLEQKASVIENAYNSVKDSFRLLSSSTKIIDSTSKYWPSDVHDQMFLYLMGDQSLLKAKGICVVGTRTPSDRGVQLAKKAVTKIGSMGLTVISGLAKGIDGVAHLQALSEGTRTVAVIGTPICSFYPPEHERLQYLIAEHGLVVSQFAPSRGIQKYYFMLRNLLMSQIGCGSFVIEDRDGGGAVQQAKYSEKQGKNVFLMRETYNNLSVTWPRNFSNPAVLAGIDALEYYIDRPVSPMKQKKKKDDDSLQPSLF